MSAAEPLRPVAHDVADAVQWHEGMLLAPQHFQQEARRLEMLLNLQMRAALPSFWGIRTIEIDELALLAGLFRVTRLEGLMPDGLPLAWPPASGQARALELDLSALETDIGASPQVIHVAVPARSERAAAPGDLRRYLSLDGPLALDQNLGDNPVPVPRLAPALALFATGSPLVGPGSVYVSLPLARIGRRDGRVQRLDYEPPALWVGPENRLAEVAGEIAREMRERAVSIVDRLRHAAAGGAVESRGIEQALAAIMAPLPRLEALLRDGAAPYAIYLSLCDALGAAAAISPELARAAPPAYSHSDALPVFVALRKLVLDGLKRLRQTGRLILFEPIGDGGFRAPAPAVDGEERLLLVLFGADGERIERTADWAGEAVVAGSAAMERIRLSRIRGATRRLVEAAEITDFALPSHALALEVALDPRFVAPGEPLEIRHPDGGGVRGEPGRVALIVSEPAAPAATEAAGGAP